jgi:predicted O-methyltransferase YrrM
MDLGLLSNGLQALLSMNLLRKLVTRIVVATQLPRNPFEGEMLPLERVTLYRWMIEHKPATVFEVGTGVGGSTFYICEALLRNGGTLHSCDPIRRPPELFLQRFRSVLQYHALRSAELIELLIAQNRIPDLLFFDGPEIPQLAIDDLKSLEPHLKPGCLFAMHDWEQAGGCNHRIVSIKAKSIRPYMESSPNWIRIQVLSGHQKNVWWTKGKFDSVGLCLYVYRPNTPNQMAA